jgi:hypothetical protein
MSQRISKLLLSFRNEKCKGCGQNRCYAKYFQQNFKSWTSNNDDIDKFIRDTQLSAHYDVKNALEWIPYDKFNNIKYVSGGEFGKEYKANWIDGNIWEWDNSNQNWERENQNMLVSLKSLNNPKSVALELENEV